MLSISNSPGNNDPIYDIACFANIRYEEGYRLLHVYFGILQRMKSKIQSLALLSMPAMVQCRDV